MNQSAFKLVAQGDVTLHRPGTYTSFPMLFRDPKTGEVLVMYREAQYNEADTRLGMRAHGLDGSLYVKPFCLETGRFGSATRWFDGQHFPPGLIDGVVNTLGDRLMVFIRRYPDAPTVFYSIGRTWTEMPPPKQFSAYPPFRDNMAEWAKIVALPGKNRLLQVFYGGFIASEDSQDHPASGIPTRPALYKSDDQGETWQFLSWIAPPYVEPGITANETAIVPLPDGRLFALMRTAGEMPGPMFSCLSEDDGTTWSAPRRSGLFGEAPMFHTLPDGTILACFRGFRPDAGPLDGGMFSLSRLNPETLAFSAPFIVEVYPGNHYDGGYGDMLWLSERQQLLVAYYFSDTPAERYPWIRYALLHPD